jgi:O-antigen/teichoic acid export membrane protein
MTELRNFFGHQLARGEKFARTDLRYIIGGGSVLFSGQAVGMLASFLLALGYAHFLSKETYGTYKYFTSIIGLFSLFALSGMEDGAKRAVAQGREAGFWTTFKARVIGGAGGMITALGLAVYYFFNGNDLLGSLFLIAAPCLVLLEPLTHYNALLIGRKLFRNATLYSIILQAVTAALLFTVMILTGSIFAMVVTYLLSGLLLRGAFFLITVRKFPLNEVADPSAVTYGGHISILGFFSTISGRLDAILLFHFLGPVSLAIYSFARALTDNVQNSFKLITTTLAFPKLAAQDKDVLKKTLGRKILLAHAITIPLSLVITFLIPYVYRLLFPQYIESVIFAQVLVVLLAFSPLRLFSTAITALAPTKMIYATSITSATLASILLLIFVPIYGIWGVIISTAIQQSIVNTLNVYLFRRM